MTVEVLDGGLLTSVQDVGGRVAWRHLGVPVGGALDPWAARAANRLVGNPDGAALLECTLSGPTLRLDAPATIALVGGLDATVDGLPLPTGEARTCRAGSVVRIRDGAEARAWLAIRGGIEVAPVLGGLGTDLRTGFGGFEGRALRAGDRLVVRATAGAVAATTGSLITPLPAATDGPIRITRGPHGASAALDALVAGPWEVHPASDRTGVRLAGGDVPDGGDVASMGLPLGAIQVPADGRAIVALADRPVTGGYRVPAVVIAADVGRVARLRPGDPVAFAVVTRETAIRARRRREAAIEAIG